MKCRRNVVDDSMSKPFANKQCVIMRCRRNVLDDSISKPIDNKLCAITRRRRSALNDSPMMPTDVEARSATHKMQPKHEGSAIENAIERHTLRSSAPQRAVDDTSTHQASSGDVPLNSPIIGQS